MYFNVAAIKIQLQPSAPCVKEAEGYYNFQYISKKISANLNDNLEHLIHTSMSIINEDVCRKINLMTGRGLTNHVF